MSIINHNQVFLTNYSKYVDHNFKKADKVKYQKKCDLVSNLIHSVNFERNLLIHCNRDYMKEVFLFGATTLSSLRTNALFNIRELVDIYMGENSNSDSTSLDSTRPDEDLYTSISDILHDVIGVSCNYYEPIFKNSTTGANILVHTIMRRYEYVEKDPKKFPKYTWVYNMGLASDFATNYPAIEDLFTKKSDNPLFGVLDMNKLFTGNVVSTPKVSNTSSTVTLDRNI